MYTKIVNHLRFRIMSLFPYISVFSVPEKQVLRLLDLLTELSLWRYVCGSSHHYLFGQSMLPFHVFRASLLGFVVKQTCFLKTFNL